VSGAEQALATLRDYVEHSTHWREGGATRHDALLALGRLGADVPSPYKPAPPTPTISDSGDSSLLVKSLADALDAPHNPADDWMTVGRSFVAEAIDHIEWLEKGNEEWRVMARTAQRHAEAARATGRVAINHLQTVLNKCRTADEQLRADTAARDWLASIGSEPT
jgi:hypothetical protein